MSMMRDVSPLLATVSAVVQALGLPKPLYKTAHVIRQG